MVDSLICTDTEKEWVKQAIVTNVRVYVRNVKTRKSDKKVLMENLQYCTFYSKG